MEAEKARKEAAKPAVEIPRSPQLRRPRQQPLAAGHSVAGQTRWRRTGRSIYVFFDAVEKDKAKTWTAKSERDVALEISASAVDRLSREDSPRQYLKHLTLPGDHKEISKTADALYHLEDPRQDLIRWLTDDDWEAYKTAW